MKSYRVRVKQRESNRRYRLRLAEMLLRLHSCTKTSLSQSYNTVELIEKAISMLSTIPLDMKNYKLHVTQLPARSIG